MTAQECKYACNANMCRVRVLVKWVFGNVINRFKSNDFKKNLKIALIPVVKFCKVGALLTNVRTSLYENVTEKTFDCNCQLLKNIFSEKLGLKLYSSTLQDVLLQIFF